MSALTNCGLRADHRLFIYPRHETEFRTSKQSSAQSVAFARILGLANRRVQPLLDVFTSVVLCYTRRLRQTTQWRVARPPAYATGTRPRPSESRCLTMPGYAHLAQCRQSSLRYKRATRCLAHSHSLPRRQGEARLRSPSVAPWGPMLLRNKSRPLSPPTKRCTPSSISRPRPSHWTRPVTWASATWVITQSHPSTRAG